MSIFYTQNDYTDAIRRPALLALFSTPSGYGKTTLMTALRAGHPGLPALWLSLDEQDDSPAAFLAALIAAFQRTWPGLGEPALQLLA